MTSPRKKPGVAFWATVVVVVVLVAYPLSFGPAAWLYSRSFRLPIWEIGDRFYHPILWTWRRGPECVTDAIDWYANLGSAFNVFPAESTDGNFALIYAPRE